MLHRLCGGTAAGLGRRAPHLEAFKGSLPLFSKSLVPRKQEEKLPNNKLGLPVGWWPPPLPLSQHTRPSPAPQALSSWALPGTHCRAGSCHLLQDLGAQLTSPRKPSRSPCLHSCNCSTSFVNTKTPNLCVFPQFCPRSVGHLQLFSFHPVWAGGVFGVLYYITEN